MPEDTMTSPAAAPSTRVGGRPDNVLRLKDGRMLGYAEYGDRHGRPAFYFHGTPGSRLEGTLTHDAAVRHGVRLICAERPGYGLSDFQPRRTILDWPDDVVQLAEALGIDRFFVAGISGGGPYAAACAYRIPQRVVGAAIISGMGPIDVPGATKGMSLLNRAFLWIGRRAPWLMRPLAGLMAWMVLRSPDRVLDQIKRSFAAPDQEVLSRPEIRAAFKEDVLEAFRKGGRGLARENALFARPWGFRLEDISVEVHLWQGEKDRNVAPTMGRYQAHAIPNCKATFYPDAGHLLGIVHVDEIMQAVVGAG